MSKKTVNYDLIKPEANDNYDIEDQNKNMDVIDGELKAINDFREGVVKFPKASGTGVLIVVTTGLFKLEDGNTITFIAHEDNEGLTTTLNVDDKGAKPIYKPGTVVAPNIKAGKAITVWYDLEHECFFIKASAEGNATAENVLAEKKFSNDDDTGLVGSMPNIGNIGVSELKNQGQEYDIPKGYHDGQGKVRADITNLTSSVIKSGSTVGGVQGTFTSDANAQANHMLSGVTAYVGGSKVTGTIPSIAAQTITPSTVNKTIAAGQYLSGTQTIAGDADLISANIKAGKNIFGVTGSANVVDTSAGDATAGQILSGKKAYVDGALVTGTIPSIAAQTITPSTANKTIAAGQYLSGTQTIAGDTDLISANIKAGKNIFGVAGNANVVDTSAGDATAGQILSGKKAYVDGALVTGTIPSIAAQTITPSTVNKTIAAGQYLSGTQTIAGDADLISANIKAGKNIFGVAGNAYVVDTSAGDATAGQILSGKKAYVDGALVTGTIPSIAAKTYTPSTVSQTIPAGKYLSGTQTISAVQGLSPNVIKEGAVVGGVTGTYITPVPDFSGTTNTLELKSIIQEGYGIKYISYEGSFIDRFPACDPNLTGTVSIYARIEGGSSQSRDSIDIMRDGVLIGTFTGDGLHYYVSGSINNVPVPYNSLELWGRNTSVNYSARLDKYIFKIYCDADPRTPLSTYF